MNTHYYSANQSHFEVAWGTQVLDQEFGWPLIIISLVVTEIWLSSPFIIKCTLGKNLHHCKWKIHISKKLDCETSNHNGERKEIN